MNKHLMVILPPETDTILIQRATGLAGKTLNELASQVYESIPLSLHQSKGWIGQLIEKHLGAVSCQLAQPDFVHLGIELKTLPVTLQGQPCESTYICTAPIPPQDQNWKTSRVWRKMEKILWVPIESTSEKSIGDLKVGTPILWSPCAVVENILRQDWEELTELMILGHFDELSAKHGKYLQIRPKAANSKTFIQATDRDGHTTSLVPKGFYVRTALTKLILESNYCV